MREIARCRMNKSVANASLEGASTEKFEVKKRSRVANPSVSVVVAVYNMESRGYLSDLVLSLKSQTLESIEFILVDDCSKDRSLEVSLDLTRDDERFAVLASRKNGRQGSARNIGLDFAQGRYIGFVDGDDVVDPDYYKELLHCAETDGAEIAVAPFIKTDERLNRISEPSIPFSEKDVGELCPEKLAVLIQKPAHVVSCLYSARLFRSLGIRFPEGVFFEDNPTCLRLLCSARAVSVLPKSEGAPKYYYRQHISSTDHRIDNLANQIKDRLETSDLMLSDAERHGYRAENNDAIELYYYRLALLNTLSKAARVPRVDLRNRIALEVRNHVCEKVRPVSQNQLFSELPVRVRMQMRIALLSPLAYVAAASFRLKMRA